MHRFSKAMKLSLLFFSSSRGQFLSQKAEHTASALTSHDTTKVLRTLKVKHNLTYNVCYTISQADTFVQAAYSILYIIQCTYHEIHC